MQLQQSFEVPFAPDAVWRCFGDTEGIVACLPGAALSGPGEHGRLPLTMTVKLGPIVAVFAGEGQIKLDDTTRSGAVTGSGADRKSGSRVKGEAAFSLHDTGAATGSGGAATRVDIAVDYAIAGSLAQFSRGGIVRELAARLTEAFADNLRKRLQAHAELPAPAPALASAGAAAAPDSVLTSSSVSASHPDSAAVPTPSAAAPLDLGSLFWPALWARLRSLLGQRPHS
ncbi:SRPBCC family protein [Cupriavidus necator]|uniref:SRPBCC family protein n=1 Tax=Cupriavidus necator TaxID=106590 RepID=UPI0005B4EEA3|nr:SRPBCC family protein [Cupriavidus necator]